ncbi:MAG: DNA-binding transcriptional regulator HexR [Alphaproteobacteria bacterium ADurb.BinA280]|nr:MAG: DNA-binding transcriptional regulator HexR [Alphaproteobacteria bacterium ADurb.BinA280]
MNDTIVELLRHSLSSLPLTERRVAMRLLADFPMAGLGSASELARTVGVSVPTVLRLVIRLGFGAYPEFQTRLREELAAQLSSPLTKAPQSADSGEGHRWQQFASRVADNVAETFQHLAADELQQIAAWLADPKSRIHLVGGRFTDALAQYVSVQMRILRSGVNHLRDQEANWFDQVLDMGSKDVLVIYDIRRYQPSLLRLADLATQRGTKVILLTDQWLSPIARVARHVLPARVQVPSPWDSNAALMALSEALLAEVSRIAGDSAQRRMRELERLRSHD